MLHGRRVSIRVHRFHTSHSLPLPGLPRGGEHIKHLAAPAAASSPSARHYGKEKTAIDSVVCFCWKQHRWKISRGKYAETFGTLFFTDQHWFSLQLLCVLHGLQQENKTNKKKAFSRLFFDPSLVFFKLRQLVKRRKRSNTIMEKQNSLPSRKMNWINTSRFGK